MACSPGRERSVAKDGLPAEVRKVQRAKAGGEAGIRTLGRALRPYNGLANRRLQPLGHLTFITVAGSPAPRRAHFTALALRQLAPFRSRRDSSIRDTDTYTKARAREVVRIPDTRRTATKNDPASTSGRHSIRRPQGPTTSTLGVFLMDTSRFQSV